MTMFCIFQKYFFFVLRKRDDDLTSEKTQEIDSLKCSDRHCIRRMLTCRYYLPGLIERLGFAFHRMERDNCWGQLVLNMQVVKCFPNVVFFFSFFCFFFTTL